MAEARSHAVWAVAATLAVHTLLAVFIDAAGVYGGGMTIKPPPPRVELVDIEVPKPPPPPPPPALPEPPPPEPEPPKATKPPPRAPREPAVRTPTPAPTPPTSDLPPPAATTSAPIDPTAGGGDVLALPDVAPAARGVPVARGARSSGRTGQGGTGGGTGSGAGSGSGSGAQPVSIAAIKKKAMPRGDYDYFDAGKDYPTEARRLTIEGSIRIRLLVDASGRVTQRTLLNKLGHGLDELAMKRAAALEFEPAIDTNDRAVASVVIWTFTFSLPK